MFLYKLLLAKVLVILGINAYASNHIEERYVFDVGSSTVKVRGYKIDLFSNQIVGFLPGYSRKVYHKSCMLNSNDGMTLTDECIKTLLCNA
ncbi:MAG: hypothetical protein MRQ09_05195 [Candidatus Midichloria sp.]|nr:hypothetical protein [Candidatus Midichloria sp.]